MELFYGNYLFFFYRRDEYERPYILKEDGAEIYTFTGSRINRTLALLLKLGDVENVYDEERSMFRISNFKTHPDKLFAHIGGFLTTVPSYIQQQLEGGSGRFRQSKWAPYLPVKFQEELILEVNLIWKELLFFYNK